MGCNRTKDRTDASPHKTPRIHTIYRCQVPKETLRDVLVLTGQNWFGCMRRNNTRHVALMMWLSGVS